MELFNEIVLTRDNFENLEEAIGQTVSFLLKAGYECKVYEDDTDIVVITYNFAERLNYGSPVLRWLTAEEDEKLTDDRGCKMEGTVCPDMNEGRPQSPYF